jgi:hypothetical protein
MPVIDKFFTLQEKRLNIEEAKVKNAATIPAAPAVKKISIDSIPMPEAEGYNSFLNYFNTLNDSQADSLLNTLQVKRPEIYTDLISKFYTDESTETV